VNLFLTFFFFFFVIPVQSWESIRERKEDDRKKFLEWVESQLDDCRDIERRRLMSRIRTQLDE
jgi:hypothetical protein